MIGLSSNVWVMESLTNSAEEQQAPFVLSNLWPQTQESSKNQRPKGFGGFVLVHAGE